VISVYLEKMILSHTRRGLLVCFARYRSVVEFDDGNVVSHQPCHRLKQEIVGDDVASEMPTSEHVLSIKTQMQRRPASN
jgi:hypothetical protein